MEDVIIIGAGPCGLSAAGEFKKRGIDPLVIEKGSIVHSIYGYPLNMRFFSTPELLEIVDVPFIVSGEKPTREEALVYYREVASRSALRIHTYEEVVKIEQEAGGFSVQTVKHNGKTSGGEYQTYRAKNVVAATGYFDNPNLMNVPGEELEKVNHYYKEAHIYYGQKVAIIGGSNNAVEAAIEIERAGGQVTWIYRRGDFSSSIKAWVRPVFESLLRKERIQAMWNTNVVRIDEKTITLNREGQEITIENDRVLALTGYHPDHKLLRSLGVEINGETGEPVYNEETMETNVQGLFIAGVIAAGNNANVIFIENGRLHGGLIADEIARRIEQA
ncbi:YpdA family putative bacillithiol disulfide reductase [Aneurinibacillus terranovensis]|uniref:YpdA family putative bacillithiol disulfide reductase n=1 Tax=Aneurinibacillus terranovensis TaxID=278991 RepID=UPI00040911D5|nr:YpdA family putative bacillithiol disulfide reductase [Aneurinibacillus terranovensis]